jgi:hypothetical protein
MGVSGQSHDPAAFYPRGKDPQYPLDRRLGGPQSRSVRRNLYSDYIASSDRMNNGNDAEENGPDLISGTIPVFVWTN